MKQNKRNNLICASMLLILIFPGCSLFSFRKLKYITYPDRANEVVPIGRALYLEFDIPVEKREAARHIKLTQAGNTINGDTSWEGNRLIYQPVPALVPGKRYIFSYKGQVETERGEHFSLNLALPFYAGTITPPLRLTNCAPPRGDDVSVHRILSLTFSRTVDTESFETGFSLTPQTEYEATWDVSGTNVTLEPLPAWKHLTFYKWQLADSITDTEGIPLAYPEEGTFLTQEDNIPPVVENIGRGARETDGFLPLPGDLDTLERQDVILLSFSEDLDFKSLSSSFKIEPSLNGNLQRIAAASYVFIPDEGFQMNTEYCLTIGTECLDLSGLAMRNPFVQRFTPAIPPLRVSTIRNFPSPANFTPADFNKPVAYPIGLALPGNNHTFVIVFSEPIDNAHREQVSGGITCKTFFPPGIPSLYFAQENVSWNASGTELSLTWVGFSRSPGIATPYYYEFSIPAGPSNTANEAGSYLEEEIRIYLEAPL